MQKPVKWNVSCQKLADTVFRVDFKASIDAGWHLYSQYLPEGNFAFPTKFEFNKITDIELVDTVAELTEVTIEKDEIAGVMTHFYSNEALFAQNVKVTGNAPAIAGIIEFQACNDEQCVKDEYEFSMQLPSDIKAETKPSSAISEAESNVTITTANSNSIWKVILEAMLWGLVALLTPCVFPMVPMTVSFFLKGENNKARATTFGLSIVALYTIPIAIIILATYFIGGQSITADIFNWLSTHWLPNIIFFIVFMVFAASFFGAFEIVLPGSLVGKSDRNSDRKGLGGVFFMALTLVLVSFSCTGPIVGTVLIKSTSGEFWAPMLTMLAFSVTFALPFTLFALFPSWLKKLPKSGGWLGSVKVVLGFIEIALGFKFLSTADQTYRWGLLDREVYLAIWIVCFAMLGFYLLGKLRFKGEEKVEHISVLRLALAIATFTFVVYMIPGMWGAPLKAISGYLPPMQTQDFVLGGQQRQAPAYVVSTSEGGFPASVKYGDSGLELPNGLQGFFDIHEAEAYSEAVGKPLFIDFTGLGCMNCREMEARVLSDPEVLRMLQESYVVVALYGDDKAVRVDESDWVTTDSGKVLKTLGKINSYYVLKEFGVNAQPYYILKGHGRVLCEPRAYDLNVEAFRSFLRKGLKEYTR